ncbi:MAG: Rieske 2Fe-2S domain-containing protein [Verrucomicrobiota bacterium]|jgi:Rieske Fe-S protein
MTELDQEDKFFIPSQATPKKVSRRQMLMTLGIGLNAVAAVLFTVPVVGYIFGPAKRKEMEKEVEWVTLGSLTQFPEGETRLATYRNPFVRPWDGATGDIPCWVRRISAAQLQVFAINCAHLGCPVRWYPQSGLFMCPCHGGVYYANGARASGPPPRGLFEYNYKIEGGELWIKAGQVPTLASPPSQASDNQPKRCLCA